MACPSAAVTVVCIVVIALGIISLADIFILSLSLSLLEQSQHHVTPLHPGGQPAMFHSVWRGTTRMFGQWSMLCSGVSAFSLHARHRATGYWSPDICAARVDASGSATKTTDRSPGMPAGRYDRWIPSSGRSAAGAIYRHLTALPASRFPCLMVAENLHLSAARTGLWWHCRQRRWRKDVRPWAVVFSLRAFAVERATAGWHTL